MDEFDAACVCLHKRTVTALKKVSNEIKARTSEIVLRRNGALYLVCGNRICFVDANGNCTTSYHRAYVVRDEEITDSILRACGFAVYAHRNELLNGFISLGNGCRMVLVGHYGSMRDAFAELSCVDAIKIRIARNIYTSTSFVFNGTRVCSSLIVGPPASGKTTLLRSIAGNLACGTSGNCYPVTVVDERNEIFPHGLPRPAGADVIAGIRKADGINMAVRLCSPQIVICDEIGTMQETEIIKNCLNSGVVFICSMHAADENELYRRACFKSLQEASVFEKLVFLQGSSAPGEVQKITECKENAFV